jgi:uncharacterized protein
MILFRMRNLNKKIKYLLLAGIIGYIFMGLFLFIFQKDQVYFPPKQDFYNCPDFLDSQKMNVNGTRFYFQNNSDRLVVFYHGNGDSACNWAGVKQIFKEENLSLIIVEYAGYSNDNKKPSKRLILKDVDNINSFIRTLNYSELIIGGFSLGSGVASYHSTLTKPDKLLLVSAYTSIKDVAHRIFFMYPLSIMLTENFDNEAYLKYYNGDLLIIHGGKDYAIPISMSRKLFDSLNTENKEFVEIKDGGHGNIFGFNQTMEKIREFVKE